VRHLISTGYLSLESREAAAAIACALEAWIYDNVTWAGPSRGRRAKATHVGLAFGDDGFGLPSWLPGWGETQLARTGQHTFSAFLNPAAKEAISKLVD
jgi:hypothetical protein